jgi:hypothetical protein
MSPESAYRAVVLLLWALVALNSWVCRGLFWDGASFLAIVLDTRTFHDFYPARAHVAWVTQAPVLLLIKAGVSDTRLLSMVYSATLFALPTALYQLALRRVRTDAVLLGTILAILAVVYLPTWFFIIGEYHTTYAAATAAMAILLTGRGLSRRDGAILCGLGALCLASYEAMIYLGPFLAAATVWSMVRGRHSPEHPTDGVARLLGVAAALAFLAGAVVATGAVIEYWDHAYFTRVRHATFDFWQDLQFIVPLTGLGVLSVTAIVWPSWLHGRAPLVAVGMVAAVLVLTIWFRQIFDPEAMLFPPAHYVARTAAGGVLLAFLAAMWVHVAWRTAPPRLLGIVRQPQVGRRLVTAMFVLVLAATVPDLALTRLWVGYLDYFRGVVTSQPGLVSSRGLPMGQWPYRLFAQDWTYPALSAIVRSAPGQGIVVAPKDYRSFPPFEPSCGTVPRLEAYRWRGN